MLGKAVCYPHFTGVNTKSQRAGETSPELLREVGSEAGLTLELDPHPGLPTKSIYVIDEHTANPLIQEPRGTSGFPLPTSCTTLPTPPSRCEDHRGTLGPSPRVGESLDLTTAMTSLRKLLGHLVV